MCSVNKMRPIMMDITHDATHNNVLVCLVTFLYISMEQTVIMARIVAPNAPDRARWSISKCVINVYEKKRVQINIIHRRD